MFMTKKCVLLICTLIYKLIGLKIIQLLLCDAINGLSVIRGRPIPTHHAMKIQTKPGSKIHRMSILVTQTLVSVKYGTRFALNPVWIGLWGRKLCLC